MVLKIKIGNRLNTNKEKAIKDVTSDKIVRLNVNLPNTLLKQFKLKTVQNNITMSELILIWINEYISK
ncbi:hypothetical protein REIP_1749 [Rickettsia endosymbiont of Ixodes pacificus]|nr:hypothetical protein REIP_p440 [Rickettsia endosymbiont of Ixodes pacificus]KJW01823.1 hypothetical protein REIP_1749 [Rickettsia endosymbiont of Ixodes pacificus]